MASKAADNKDDCVGVGEGMMTCGGVAMRTEGDTMKGVHPTETAETDMAATKTAQNLVVEEGMGAEVVSQTGEGHQTLASRIAGTPTLVGFSAS